MNPLRRNKDQEEAPDVADPSKNVIAVRVHTLALVAQLRGALSQYERDWRQAEEARRHA